MKTRTAFTLAAALTVVAVVLIATAAEPDGKSHKLTTVSMRKMADSLHAVIAADRQAYAALVEQRMSANLAHPSATGKPGGDPKLPSHAQMLRTASSNIQRGGAEFSHTLRSLWPIDPRHGPQTESEQVGLEAVAQHPEENYYVEETLGGRSYFTAVYADRATLSSCVACHNKDPRSARHDFKTNDIMGGIIIRIPLEF